MTWNDYAVLYESKMDAYNLVRRVKEHDGIWGRQRGKWAVVGPFDGVHVLELHLKNRPLKILELHLKNAPLKTMESRSVGQLIEEALGADK